MNMNEDLAKDLDDLYKVLGAYIRQRDAGKILKTHENDPTVRRAVGVRLVLSEKLKAAVDEKLKRIEEKYKIDDKAIEAVLLAHEKKKPSVLGVRGKW